MFVGRSSGRRLVAVVLLGALPIGLGACGLLIGLEDHQAFPGVDAGEDADDRPDATPDVLEDALTDVVTDACNVELCSGVCVDTSTDAKNCGACGAVCSTGFTCTASVCGDHIEQISAGSNHGCALLHDGSIWCWGSDLSGQLGIPAAKDTMCNGVLGCQPTPTRVEGLPLKMLQVSAGPDATCAVAEGGIVWCWGLNDSLQLGRPTSSTSPSPNVDRTPLPVPGLPPVAQVSVGYGFACARLADGSKVYCWGSNMVGALGNGFPEGMPGGVAPGPVASVPAGVVDLSTGLGDHACAVTAAHEVWCWGSNSHGQLGHDPAKDSSVCPTAKCTSAPYQVVGLTVSGARIWAGAASTCTEVNGGLQCWGSNVNGQLGVTPDILEHFVPALVPQGLDAKSGTFQGSYATGCALTKTGANCWGDDSWGELGRGVLVASACAQGGFCDPVPGAVKLAATFAPRQLATGAYWAMALSDDNQIYAWGANLDGRIGHAPGTAGDLDTCGSGKENCNPVPQLIPRPGASQ